jgi:hypothetical protein
MKILSISFILSICLLVASCATPGGLRYFGAVPVPIAGVYNGGTTLGAVANNDDVKPIRTGKACVHSVLQLVSAGDGGIDAAKREGNITKVASVDYDFMNILGIYGEYCTVVKGE